MDSLSEFIQGYINAVRFCGFVIGDSPDSDLRSPDDIGLDLGAKTMARLSADARRFFMENREDLDTSWEGTGESFESLGSDFWYSREGHGTGFWDNSPVRDAADPEATRQALDRLDRAAKAEGEGGLFRVYRNAIHFL